MLLQSYSKWITPTKYSDQNGLLATGLSSTHNNNLSLSQNFEFGSDILSKSSL